MLYVKLNSAVKLEQTNDKRSSRVHTYCLDCVNSLCKFVTLEDSDTRNCGYLRVSSSTFASRLEDAVSRFTRSNSPICPMSHDCTSWSRGGSSITTDQYTMSITSFESMITNNREIILKKVRIYSSTAQERKLRVLKRLHSSVGLFARQGPHVKSHLAKTQSPCNRLRGGGNGVFL